MTRFAAGDRVRIAALPKEGHVRIPYYARRHQGEIVSYCGRYLNPEDLARGITGGPAVDLYRVGLSLADLWPDEDHPPEDRLILEVYDHWLIPAEEAAHAP